MHRSLIVAASLLLAATPLAAQEATTDLLQRGADQYGQRDYAAALSTFQTVLKQTPNDRLAQLWEGLTQVALSDVRSGEDAWMDPVQDPHFGAMADILMGLSHWRKGDLLDAKSYFGWCRAPQVLFQACAPLAARMDAGDPAPALDEWVKLAGLREAVAARAGAPARTATVVAVRTAPPTPAARPDGRAPATTAPGARPAGGHFQPGDEILLRAGGHRFIPGTVVKLGDDAGTAGSYLIRSGNGTWWEWHTDVYPTQRDASWTAPLMGDWDVHVPMSVNTMTDGRKVYDVYSGGMRLPPLRISPDGTYVWSRRGKEPIRGRWVPRTDAPGIVLLKADEGADWTVWLANSSSTIKVLKRDEIQMDAPGKVYQAAWRIVSGK